LRTRAIPERLRGVITKGAIQINVYRTLPYLIIINYCCAVLRSPVEEAEAS